MGEDEDKLQRQFTHIPGRGRGQVRYAPGKRGHIWGVIMPQVSGIDPLTIPIITNTGRPKGVYTMSNNVNC